MIIPDSGLVFWPPFIYGRTGNMSSPLQSLHDANFVTITR